MSNPLSAQQLAEVLAINVDTVRQMTRDGLLPHHRIGAGTIRYTLADVLAHTAVNQHPDDEAVDKFAAAMHAKMAQARAKGKEGWEERDDLRLIGDLTLSAEAGEWVDVANYAMMLWARGQSK
jgi:excisionase family DNA binding protein